MAVITSASSGNFSAPATWVGGVVPGVNDDAVAATTHVVTIDVDVTVLSFQQAGTGKFVLGNGRTITGNVIANAGTFASGGTIEATMTTGNTAVINGNLTGVSSTTSNIAGVVITGTGALTINGSVTGSPGNNSSTVNSSAAVYTNVTNTINVNGDITAGTGTNKQGVYVGASSNATVTTNGNITGGGGESYALFHTGTSGVVSITATNIIGGSGFNARAVNVTGNSQLNVIATEIRAGNGGGSVIHGGVSGVITINASLIQGGTQNNLYGYSVGGASTISNVTATTIRGGTGGNAVGVLSQGGTLNITVGTVEGRYGGFGIRLLGAVVMNITATTIIGSGDGGVRHEGGNGTVNAIATAIAKDSLSHAIRSDATSNGLIFQGNMTDAIDGTVAVYARVFRMTATANGVTKYASGPNNPFGTLVSRVDPSNSAGMPAISNVRSGTTYGTSNEFTGTVAVPTASQVMYGVPVDGSTGTAEFDLTTVADIVREQVYAGAYERTTL